MKIVKTYLALGSKMVNRMTPRPLLFVAGFYILVSLSCGFLCAMLLIAGFPNLGGSILFVFLFCLAGAFFPLYISWGLLRRKTKILNLAKKFTSVGGAISLLGILAQLGPSGPTEYIHGRAYGTALSHPLFWILVGLLVAFSYSYTILSSRVVREYFNQRYNHIKEKCHNHPEKNSIGTCRYCGRYLCAECLVEGKGYYYCKNEEDCMRCQEKSISNL